MAQPSTSTTSAPSTASETLSIPTTPVSLLDLFISLHLSLWPTLSLAISLYTLPAPSPSNPSPASTGTEVRDWLSGAISSMIQNSELRDQEDLEEVLLQVMGDEFEVVVEDGSEAFVASRIWRGAERLNKDGKDGWDVVVKEVEGLWEEWMQRRGKKFDAKSLGKSVEVEEDAQDTDAEEDGDEDEDEEMGEAPGLVDVSEKPRRERVVQEPEVDEEGFTKVVRGKRR